MANAIVEALVVGELGRILAKGEDAPIDALEREIPKLINLATAARVVAAHIELESTELAAKRRAAAAAKVHAELEVKGMAIPGIGTVARGSAVHVDRVERMLEIRHAEERLEKARRATATADRAAQAAREAFQRGSGSNRREQLENAAHTAELIAKSATDTLREAEAELAQLRKLA